MKKSIFLISAVWILLVSISFSWNYMSAKKEQEPIAFQTARSFFDQIVITRKWNAGHGGVYVPVTDDTHPNPYLGDYLRDIEVNRNLKLTKVNPAFMTRQIAEIAAQQEGIRFHITSLKSIRPENKPTAQEENALKSFETGKKEIGEIITDESRSSFFYMAPLITEEACLKCHAEQGYKEGDIRGGISVTLPFLPAMPFMSLIIGHFTIGLAGLCGIIFFGVKLDRAYEKIKKQAVIDALTGIPNRRSFSERIPEEFRNSRRNKLPLSIIMCDIDNFKSYNDNYGHTKGDECLKQIAQIIKKTLQRPRDFCARYGGEEFVIVLPDTSEEGAVRVAEEIRETVQKTKIPHANSSPLDVVTLSLGVSTMIGDALTPYEKLVQQADKALYMAKQKGRNCVCGI
jgi:diguanylate cyclase (GGDEF)-like protein